MNSMKRLFFAITIITLPVFMQAQVDLDLQKCRELALEYSKKMAIATQQKNKATFDRKAYKANYLPRLSATGLYFYKPGALDYSLSGGYLPTYTPGADGALQPNLLLDGGGQPIIGPDGNPVFKQYAYMPDMELELGLEGVGMAGLQLEQPLYMGGKIRTANQMAEIGEAIAHENIRLNTANTITEVDEAYWQYVSVKEKLSTAQKYQSLLQQLVKNLTDAYETGMSSRNDLLKARVKYNQASLMVQKANNGMALSRMNLCRVVGLPLQAEIHVQDTLPVLPSSETIQAAASLENRPELHMLEKDVALKSKEINLVRSDFLPQVGVSASYSYFSGVQLNGVNASDDSFSALASIKIPIFNWGEGRNKVKAAKAMHQMSQLKLEEAQELMELEMAQARFNLKDARARVEMTLLSMEQAEENLKVSQDQYELGMETLTNHLEAQAQWQEAHAELIDAKADLKVSETRYLKAIGLLDQEIIPNTK